VRPRPTVRNGARLYPQARPPGNDGLGLNTIDDDELLTPGGSRDETDGADGHFQLLGQQPNQRMVRRAGDRRRGDVSAQHAVNDAIDTVGPGPRCQSDGEANVGGRQDSEQPQEDGQGDEDDQRCQVESAGSRQRAADRREDRLRRRVDE
jgi:hypothetical protein